MISLARRSADSICSLVRCGSVEVDRAVVVGHVERDGGHVEEADEGGGEHVLSGVLLHVVAAAGGVDLAADAGSGLYDL